jgi:hypothetical protein
LHFFEISFSQYRLSFLIPPLFLDAEADAKDTLMERPSSDWPFILSTKDCAVS